MADEALARAGLHFDELNKIRVLEPEVAQQTVELKEECKEFVDSMYVNTSNGATVINYNKSIYMYLLICIHNSTNPEGLFIPVLNKFMNKYTSTFQRVY